MPRTDAIVRLRSRAELIATLPYLLGYQIEDSLVVVAVDDGRLGVIQRFDLTGARCTGPVRGALDVVRRTLNRDDPEAVVIVAYETAPNAGTALRRAVAGLCDRNGWVVLADLVVRGDQWWDADADDLGESGRPVQTGPQVPAVAECVVAGLAPLSGRDCLGALFEPGPRSPVIGERIVAERRRRTRDDTPHEEVLRGDVLAWRMWLAGDLEQGATADSPAEWAQGADAAEECLASCVVSLDNTDLRDALAAWLAPGLLPPTLAPGLAWARVTECLGPVSGTQGQGAVSRHDGVAAVLRERSRNRLIDALRLTPATEQAPMLAVLGAVTWAQGDGALASEAVDRARLLRPSYTLACLLQEMIREGLRF